MATTQLYYFSGTGNSLAVARHLSECLPDSHLTAMLALRQVERIVPEAETIGLIFPIHAFGAPRLVEDFVQRLRLTPDAYVFAAATRMGSPCRVFHTLNGLLERQDRRLNAGFFIDMPVTWLLYWDSPNAAEQQRLFARASQSVETIANLVRRRQDCLDYEHAPWVVERVFFPLLRQMGLTTRFFGLERSFYADENCTGCGVCAQVCPVNKIRLEEGKPQWDRQCACVFCFGCIHYCPTHAIQIRHSATPKRGRYHHPDVSAQEIAQQKAT